MANKFHNKQVTTMQLHGSKAPAQKAGSKHTSTPESTAAWKTSIGAGGPTPNKVGWPKIKHAVKTTL